MHGLHFEQCVPGTLYVAESKKTHVCKELKCHILLAFHPTTTLSMASAFSLPQNILSLSPRLQPGGVKLLPYVISSCEVAKYHLK